MHFPRSAGLLRSRYALSLIGALLLILVATLLPASAGEGQPRQSFTCLLCDDHGAADAVLNVILFMPFGLALGQRYRRGLRPLLYGALLSCAIELTQHVIPGRDPSLRDVLTNTLGAGLGQLLARGAPWYPRAARHAARLSLLWSGVTMLIFLLTAWLLAPAFPKSTYYVRWTPATGPYRGRVVSAALGPLALPPQRLDQASGKVRAMLLAGGPLRIQAIAGAPMPQFRSLLRVRDERHRQLLRIGPDRDDLVLLYRTRSAAVRLDQPDLRLRGALDAVRLGDTLRISAWREGTGICLRVNAARACRIGFTLGSAWTLFWYPEHVPAWIQGLFGVLWIGGLFLPAGVWSRRRPETFLAIGVLVLGLIVLPSSVGLLATPLTQVLAAICGWLAGVWLVGGLRRRRRRP